MMMDKNKKCLYFLIRDSYMISDFYFHLIAYCFH